MIVGIGVDLVKIERIARLLDRYGKRLADKILSPAEMPLFAKTKNPTAMLAKRFAAKEAVAKALGTGMRGGVYFPQIEITNKPSGAPVVLLGGKARERAEKLRVKSTHVSISDEEDFVVAFAVMETNESG